MKVACIQNNEIKIREIDNIELNNRKGAIVRVLGCGLCGSDIVKFKQNLVKNGTVLGHEIVGIIEEINSDTDFSIGDRIVAAHHIPCFECTYCMHGNHSMCSHFKETNLEPGGFSEKIFLSEEHLKYVTFKVPAGIPDEEITFFEPLGCCIRAINRCYLRQNDTALVIGLGSIGLLMAEALKAMGYKVFGCDLIEERVLKANIRKIESYTLDNPEMFEGILRHKTGGHGIDAVFMTSGSDRAINTAFQVVKMGGKILVFSSTPQDFGYANNQIYYKELTVLGGYSSSPKDLEQAFDYIISKKVNVKNLTTTYEMNDIQNAINDTVQNKTFKAYIKIDTYKDY